MAERILVVEDDEHMQYMLRQALKTRGFESANVPSAEAALQRLRAERFDLVLLDVLLEGGMTGMEALPQVLAADEDMPVIVMTAYGSREMAIEAIQAGAYDFFEKPFKMDELTIVVRRALEKRALAREVSALSERLEGRLGFDNIVGQSDSMRAVLSRVGKVAGADVTVLIHGESGTGKGLLAEAIHHNSPRRGRPFVTLTCTAIPDTLLESELFGHEKGAFTGADERRTGKFEQANGGTIFLDEIGDMSFPLQAKILRVIEKRECEPLGGSQTLKLDVRIIAATNRDLDKAVEEGSFRSDLYHRLNVFRVVVPPLREHKEDIPLLVEHFVRELNRKHKKSVAGFSAEVMQALLTYDWPGNVRELANLVEGTVVVADAEVIGAEALPTHIRTYQPKPPDLRAIPPGRGLDEILQSIERQLILDALRRTGGVQSRAAKLLDITERSLWHRVRKLGINVEAVKDAPLEP